ncbi:MAG TPA: glycosyltransferase, partial [Tepidisphaeraceae bacterium]|nr:glycosyltransferase [Tepidisphaeraceae bacterium]
WEGLQNSLLDLIARFGLSGKVTLAGQLSDEHMRQELGRAAFFISASRYEGFGISAIEAMAAGCIPLLSDIPAFRNLLEDGANGFLIDFDNPERAAARLQEAMAGDRDALAQAAQARAEDFAWERKLPVWKGLYEQLATSFAYSKSPGL